MFFFCLRKPLQVLLFEEIFVNFQFSGFPFNFAFLKKREKKRFFFHFQQFSFVFLIKSFFFFSYQVVVDVGEWDLGASRVIGKWGGGTWATRLKGRKRQSSRSRRGCKKQRWSERPKTIRRQKNIYKKMKSFVSAAAASPPTASRLMFI